MVTAPEKLPDELLEELAGRLAADLDLDEDNFIPADEVFARRRAEIEDGVDG